MLPRLLNKLTAHGQFPQTESDAFDELITELAILDTGRHSKLVGELDEYILDFPEFITLRARLIPIFVGHTEKSLRAFFSVNGKDLVPGRPFKGHEVKAIEIQYDHVGVLESGKGFSGVKVTRDLELELENGLLMKHAFPVFQGSHLRVSKNQEESGDWKVSVTGQSAFYQGADPVFHGGGSFARGADLMDLKAQYFTLSSLNGSHTQVVPMKDVNDPNYLSVGSSLRLGGSQLWLCDDLGDRHPYRSISYKQNNLAENQVDITYQLQGGNK